IDYSLFVVNRFRDELAAGASREDAIAITMSTAGRAITFSGVTVAIGLSAMLFYQGTFLASMGAAGAIVVGIAVVYGLTFLPAVLAVLGPHVGDVPGQDQTAVEAVVYYPSGSPLTAGHVGDTYDLSRRLAQLPNVLRVQSIVDVDPSYSKADYERLFAQPVTQLPSTLQQALSLTTGPHLTVLYVVTNKQYTSDEARDLVRAVRAEHVPDGQVLATGATAFDLDIVDFVLSKTPTAIAAVIVITYLVLFLLTGSVVLPLKAVITNVFSISASFGALVFIFQQGHLADLLGFTPQSIDPSIPVILFSIVFGMSMDYEVLLISRIQEEYRRTGDNQSGVALGLEKSGRLITGAAAIMCAVFLAFGLAQVVIIKSIGIG